MSREEVKIEIATEGAIAQMTIICQTEAMAIRMAKFLEKITLEIDRESKQMAND